MGDRVFTHACVRVFVFSCGVVCLYVYIFGAVDVLIICLPLIEFHLNSRDWQICWKRTRIWTHQKPKKCYQCFHLISALFMNYLCRSPFVIYLLQLQWVKMLICLVHLKEECCWLDKWVWSDNICQWHRQRQRKKNLQISNDRNTWNATLYILQTAY